MDRDVMSILRDADPARRVDLDAVDGRAYAAVEEGILMTPRPRRTRTARRWTWGAVATVSAAALALGGGTAYAGYHLYNEWYVGAHDGLNCVTSWEATTGTLWNDERRYGGASMSDDPVADCRSYAELTGKGPIADPVAVRLIDGRLVVGPSVGRPADATLVPAITEGEDRVAELGQSLDDYVDGGLSRCFSADEMTGFVQEELSRLGLHRWTITERDDARPASPCSVAMVAADQEVIVAENFMPESDVAPTVLSAALRTQVAEQCLTLPEAERAVTQILGDDHHWPTFTRVDSAASCTRVDVELGGSAQVFLRGPEG